MSSVSSFEGSDKDSFFQRSFLDGATSSARHSYLRKTDFLDNLDVSRLRDTDAWSVAATVDDQESVISAQGGPPSITSRYMDREIDDDRSTLDGDISIREHMQDLHLVTNNNTANSHTKEGASNQPHQSITNNRIETLRDLIDSSGHHQHILRSVASLDDEDDKRSRSNAAEFGDDGARSATGDFDNSVVSDDEDQNNLVDDQIMAPPQPQPSFASDTKPYAVLMEENEILQSQLRDAQLAQKHQDVLISNLRTLTNCDEEIFEKALELSRRKVHDTISSSEEEEEDRNKNTTTDNKDNNTTTNAKPNDELYFESPSLQHESAPIIVNARTLTHRLAQLAETLNRFVNTAVKPEWRLKLEQSLFAQIIESYLTALPFGTENQDLLNTAYSDQISRFHNTLGANFAKWYRRQTVQSLSLNHATKEYLQDMHTHLTKEMLRLVNSVSPNHDDRHLDRSDMWGDILNLCAALSLEIHGGDADVSTQSIAVGSKFDQDIMTLVNESSGNQEKIVQMVISPLFIDEEDTVLLPARVVLK